MSWSFLVATPGDGPVGDRQDGRLIRFAPDVIPVLWFGCFEAGDEIDVLATIGTDDPRPYPCEMLWVPREVALERARLFLEGLRSCRRVRTREDVLLAFLHDLSRIGGAGVQLHDAEFQAIAGRRELTAWRRECLMYAGQVRSGVLEGDAVLQSGHAEEVFEAAGISPTMWRCTRPWEWSLAGWQASSHKSTSDATPFDLTPLT